MIDGAAEVRNHSSAFEWKSDAANRLSFMVFLVGFDLFRAVAMMMVVLSGLSVGQMIAVFGYLWFMMGPVQELLRMQYSYFAANARARQGQPFTDARRRTSLPLPGRPF